MLFICEVIIFFWWKNEFNISCDKYISKSNIEEECLMKFLMNVSTKGLKDYLECVSIYQGTSPKKKADLIEMIAYGCMTGTLNNKDLEDTSINQANEILNKNYLGMGIWG